MNTAAQPVSKVISPCERCIVRTTCTKFCLKWIMNCQKTFPSDEEITLEEFQKTMNVCGPLQNFFLKEGALKMFAITFPKNTSEHIIIAVK